MTALPPRLTEGQKLGTRTIGACRTVGTHPSHAVRRRWSWVCDCGHRGEASERSLLSSKPGCASCAKDNGQYGPSNAEFAGRVFGRLTAIERVPGVYKQGSVWRCKCLCSKETKVRRKDLTNGNTTSCGCLKAENLAFYGNRRVRPERMNRAEAAPPAQIVAPPAEVPPPPAAAPPLSNAERQRRWRQRHKDKPMTNKAFKAEIAAVRDRLAAEEDEEAVCFALNFASAVPPMPAPATSNRPITVDEFARRGGERDLALHIFQEAGAALYSGIVDCTIRKPA